MHKNSYLYGEEEVPEIDAETIMRRIEALKDNLSVTLDEPHEIRDETRVRAILKAIRFWDNINKEETNG